MHFETKIIIDNIADSIINQHLCVFCGAGATADANNIMWSDLLKQELDLLDDSSITDYYKVAKYYEMHFGRDKLVNSVISSLESCKASNHINKLIQLPILEFWTTNFDTIIEDMITSKYGKATVIYNKNNLFQIKGGHTVYKMNGTIKDSRSLVLTTDDYSQYYINQDQLVNHLKIKLIMNSFLFIGYSFNDNLVLKCLNDIKNSKIALTHFHYRFVKYDEKNKILLLNEQKYFETSFNIKTIFVNDFEEIDEIIDAIKKEIDMKNIFISGSFRNLNSKEEDRANLICNELTNKLLENGYIIHTGNGKNLGSYIISNTTINSNKYNYNINQKLKIKQLISHDFFKVKNKKMREQKRIINKMLSNCKTIIFLYGQYIDNSISKGMLTEYEEAKKHNMILIPILSTNYAAEHIFNTIVQENKLDYIIKFKDELKEAFSPEEISNVVLKIIKYLELNKE